MKSALPFFVCFVVICSNARASDTSDWKRSEQEGRKALEKLDFTRAETFYTQASAAAERFGKDDERYSKSLRGLGFAALQLRDYPNADFAFTRLISADGQRLGTNSLAVADDLIQLTEVAGYSEQFLRGRESIDAATAIVLKRFGDHSPAMGICLATRGDLEMQEQHHAAAETNYQKALEIFKTRGVKTYFTGLELNEVFFQVAPEYNAQVLNNLSLCQIQEQKFSQAENSASLAIKDIEYQYGKNTVKLVDPLDNLGNAYANQKKFAEAERVARRAVSLVSKVDPKHPMVQTTRQLLAAILTSEGKTDEAAKYREP